MSDSELLAAFIHAFEKLNDLVAQELIAPELEAGMDDSQWARPKWKPAAIRTDPLALDEIYRRLPGRFPPLYEQLVLSYRWIEVELDGIVTLLGNPPGPTLAGLEAAINADSALVEVLFPVGMIPFGKAPGGSYDPICFDTGRRRPDGDCAVVRVEHEAISCDARLGDSWEVASSFRFLAESVVAKAAGR